MPLLLETGKISVVDLMLLLYQQNLKVATSMFAEYYLLYRASSAGQVGDAMQM